MNSAASLSVVKLGGSVLTGLAAYRATASFLASERARDESRKVLAVVSAEFGHTDELAEEAAALSRTPDAGALDLLWSTGELRSVALLTLALEDAGVSVAALNAHETGLRLLGDGIDLNPIALRAKLSRHAVVVAPGFLATRNQQLVTLGRGGSDLSAVLLAVALAADECVLVKDVDGYFTDDPATNASAKRLDELTYADAIAMANAGCPLVQRQALVEAKRARIRLVVRSVNGVGTIVTD